MKKGILITLPRHDDVTEYLSQFSQQIEDVAKEKSIEIKALRDKEAVKEVFEKIIKKQDYKMVIFNGHGSDKIITGNKEIFREILSTFRFISTTAESVSEKTFCDASSDCVLWLCAGPLNKEYAKTLPPDLPCAMYDGYSVSCIDHDCSAVR